MKSIMQLLKFLFSGLGAGVDTIRKLAPQVALPYLRTLEKFTFIAVGIPIALVGVGFVVYWISLLGKVFLLSWLGLLEPLWRISVLLGGACALGFGVLLAVLAVPIGALISAATVPPQSAIATTRTAETLPWYRWFSPIGILREFRSIGAELMQSLRTAIERYIDAVKTVLVVAGFGFFFFAALPRPSVTLLLFCIVGVATIWLNRAYKTVWSWLAQAGAILVMLMFVFRDIFPKLEPGKLVLGGTSAGEFTNENLTSRWDVWVKWTTEHWIGVAVAVAVVLLLTYLLVKMFRRGTASVVGTTDHHSGSGWLGKAAVGAVLVFFVGLLAMKLMEFHERRDARIDAQMEAQKTMEKLRASIAAAIPAPRPSVPNGQQSVATPAPAAPTEWCDIRSPTLHKFQFTTNWSLQIPRPTGMSVRTSPGGLDYDLRENGVRILQKNSAGMVEFTTGTRFIEFRAHTTPSTPIEMTVGVGNEAH